MLGARSIRSSGAYHCKIHTQRVRCAGGCPSLLVSNYGAFEVGNFKLRITAVAGTRIDGPSNRRLLLKALRQWEASDRNCILKRYQKRYSKRYSNRPAYPLGTSPVGVYGRPGMIRLLITSGDLVWRAIYVMYSRSSRFFSSSSLIACL